MAHPATISQWLPGFDPDSVEFPDLFSDADSSIPVSTDVSPAIESVTVAETPADSVQAARSTWLAPVVAQPTASRQPWHPLSSSEFQGAHGAVGKFDANIAAIELLRQIEGDNRAVTVEEAATLRRFSGWGGIPESFNPDGESASWRKRADSLREFLTDDEYEAARASVNNGHFTEIHIVESIWKAIRGFGFNGGRILEPSAGIGHFIGAMPSDIAETSSISAIEIDQVSGRILRALYGASGVDVRITAFEQAALSNNWFDLVIGNVPFGKYKVADGGNRPYSGFTIHHYFFGRALDLVRPGGLVCLITSSYLFDADHNDMRQYLASEATLLGAIRLPTGAFSEMALTHAQADILFLRKGQSCESNDADWMDLIKVPSALRHPDCYYRDMQINCWFTKHPEFCIDKVTGVSNGYEIIPTAVFDGELAPELLDRIALLPKDVYCEAQTPFAETPRPVLQASIGAKPGSYVVHGNRMHQVEGTSLIDVHDQLNAMQRARIVGMCTVRDCARGVLEAQLDGSPDDELSRQRARLNSRYDIFVAKYGYLSTRANALAFRRDPDYPLLLSLEHFDDESGKATKADLFTKRTLSRVSEPVVADSPEAALAASMQWRGRVDAGYMASLLSASEQAVLDALSDSGQIYCDPQDRQWKTSDEYLSGNVKEKLSNALASGATYRRNVTALEQVQPEDLEPGKISVRLGAVWIPTRDIEAFIHEVFALDDCKVSYSAQAGTWSVTGAEYKMRNNVKVTQEFGTSRINAVELVVHALNVQVPTIRDLIQVTGRYVINRDETLVAREKLGLIKERFASWVFEETVRRERLCRLYNDTFNATRPRRFDGSHLTLPGFSHCFNLHSAQKDAIWRIVQSGNTGLFHAVGAGKTAICCAANMELRRLGFANKPCHVVPNHMLEQYTAEFVRLYPNASVLMASKDDLAGDRRKELVSRIATGDWDAVILTHSSFERIQMSPGFSETFVKGILADLERAIRIQRGTTRGRTRNRIVKQLELMKKNWTVKLEKLLALKKKDDLLTWEQLGIDYLFVDEAHLFKNLFRYSKMTRVAGLPMSSSERAFDLFLKTRYTMQLYGNRQRGVVLSTATPVANTLAEVHTMMRYLQPNRLVELGLQEFDAWAATFGESVTALEIAPDGSGYRMHTRFARFINVPELMAIFGEVADIRTAEMLNLPIPKLVGGKAQIVSSPRSVEAKLFVDSLVERAKLIREGKVQPRDDNMLAVTTDGRKAALDMRLIFGDVEYDEDSKVGACLQSIRRIWSQTVSFRGVQIVFCDMSSPKAGRAFSVYDDMRERLVASGIPESEIAFIHDADSDSQKAKLFKAVRDGCVRVIFGSTGKMGIGTNVQTRLCALHHLDAPWRPCDVEQREGRILRQGNTCIEVEIYRYVTEGSFDAYIWQTLETKARFIAQVMKGDQGIRALEDVELAALSYAEVKALASGNPMVIEKAGVDADVARLSTLFSVWRNQRYANESEVSRLPATLDSLDARIAAYAEDCKQLKPQAIDNFVVQIGKVSYVGAEDAGNALRDVVKSVASEIKVAATAIEKVIGSFGGFELGVYASKYKEWPNFFVKGKGVYHANPYQAGAYLVTALLDTLESIRRHHSSAISERKIKSKRWEGIKRELERPFEHEARLMNLLARQRELEALLDLDKDEAGTEGLSGDEEKQAA